MMQINTGKVIFIKNVTIPAERILKKLYFAENTETGQGMLTQTDLLEYYVFKATEKEKRTIEKIIPYHDVIILTNEHTYEYIIVV